jgi:RNA polymerase sigma-70 factor (ECF subfamily)
VAKRQAISNFRKEVVRQQFQLSHQSQWNEAHDHLEKIIESKDLVLFLQEVIDKLPAMQQRVFRMNKLEELSYQEISEQIGISKNTVRNHLVAAYQFVRLRMENMLFLLFL